MENNFKGTQGDLYKLRADRMGVPFIVYVNGSETIAYFYNQDKENPDEEVAEANCDLFMDAQKTIVESGMFPSELLAEYKKLKDFKEYVHNRLDGMNIEKDPESEHKEKGCRIGGRLDIVEAKLNSLQKIQKGLENVINENIKHL